MKVSFNIGKYCYLLDIDNHNAEILLAKYFDWFSEFDNRKYKMLFQFEKHTNTSKNLLKYYELKDAEKIGENKEKKELIVKKNNCIYMNTHLFHNESVYMSLNLLTSYIRILYFSDLSIDDLMALIKTAFIWANNHISTEFTFLMHACAVEIEKDISLIFIGASGAGKTTVSRYCQENGYLVLSDETILLWKESKSYSIQGTPWHGSEGTVKGSAKICRLDAIYILNKHKKDFYEKSINQYENKCTLLNQWLNCAHFNIDKLIQGIKFIADLTTEIDIYNLFFTKSSRFIDVLRYVRY